MSQEILQARRWARVMAAASLGGTALALAAWCAFGLVAGVTVYGTVIFILAVMLIARVAFRSFAPTLGAERAPVMVGRKTPP